MPKNKNNKKTAFTLPHTYDYIISKLPKIFYLFHPNFGVDYTAKKMQSSWWTKRIKRHSPFLISAHLGTKIKADTYKELFFFFILL